MFCCGCCFNFKRPSEDKVTPTVVDVQRIMEDFVWSEYMKKFKGCKRALLRRKDFTINVPMNYFHFETVSQRLKERSCMGQGSEGHLIRDHLKSQDEEASPTSSPKGKGSVELKTIYTNKTPEAQTYEFRLERSRKSTLTYTIQTGFSVGGKAKLDVKLPSTTLGGEVDMRYTITETDGSSIDEAATFATNSSICVPKNSECVAKVVMDEVTVDYDFRVKTLMTLLRQGATATIRRKKDGELFYYYAINDVDRAFKKYESSHVIIDPDVSKLLDKKENENGRRGNNGKDQGEGNDRLENGDVRSQVDGGGETGSAKTGSGDARNGDGGNGGDSNKAEQIAMTSGKKAGSGGGQRVGMRILFVTTGVIQGVRLSDQRIALESFSFEKEKEEEEEEEEEGEPGAEKQ